MYAMHLRIQNYAENFPIWLKSKACTRFSVAPNTYFEIYCWCYFWRAMTQPEKQHRLPFLFKSAYEQIFPKQWLLETHNIQKVLRVSTNRTECAILYLCTCKLVLSALMKDCFQGPSTVCFTVSAISIRSGNSNNRTNPSSFSMDHSRLGKL